MRSHDPTRRRHRVRSSYVAWLVALCNRCPETEQIAQRFLVQADVAWHKRAAKRKKGKGLAPARLALGAHRAHHAKEAFGVRLEVPQQRLVLPVADRRVDLQLAALLGDPRVVRGGRAPRLGRRPAEIVCNLEQLQLPIAPVVLGHRRIGGGVDPEGEADMCEHARAEVHPDIGSSDGGKVATLVAENLAETLAVDRLEGRHPTLARGAQCRNGLCGFPAVRDLVVGGVQPVPIENVPQAVVVALFNATTHMQVEQLRG